MRKEFVEYHNENGTIPYSASTICFCLTQYAKDYIKENRKIISKVDTKVRDAVLVDAINYLGVQGWCIFALYTHDLYDEIRHDEVVDPQCLLSAIPNHYANYIFSEGASVSVLRNNHMNKCVEPFNENDGALVLVDFINYIAQRNDFDRTFTIQELYERAQNQQHNIKMKRR